MSGLIITINDSGVLQKLQEMQERSLHMRPMMSAAGMIMLKSVHENFDAEGRPSKWKPLSIKTLLARDDAAAVAARKTAKWKNAKRATTKAKIENERVQKMRGNKILQNTGKLRNSIVLGRVTDNSVEIGSSLPYARIHQLGGKIGETTIRARSTQALMIPTQYGIIFRKQAIIPEREIPARPYLLLQPEDYKTIGKIADDYIVRGEIG